MRPSLEGCEVCWVHDGEPALAEGGAVRPSQLPHELPTHRKFGFKKEFEATKKERTNSCITVCRTWMQFLMFSLLGFSSSILEANFRARPYILLAIACLYENMSTCAAMQDQRRDVTPGGRNFTAVVFRSKCTKVSLKVKTQAVVCLLLCRAVTK